MRHLLIVANGFRAAGLLLGIPSLLLFLWLITGWIDVNRLKLDPSGQASSRPFDLQRDGIVGILVAGGTVIGKGFELAGKAGAWLLGVFSVVAAVLTVAGGGLFFTGRGLALHAGWARIAAGLAAAGVLMISLLVLTSLRRAAVSFALIPFGLSSYVLWVVIRKFT